MADNLLFLSSPSPVHNRLLPAPPLPHPTTPPSSESRRFCDLIYKTCGPRLTLSVYLYRGIINFSGDRCVVPETERNQPMRKIMRERGREKQREREFERVRGRESEKGYQPSRSFAILRVNLIEFREAAQPLNCN